MDCRDFLNLFLTLTPLVTFFKQASRDITLSTRTRKCVCMHGAGVEGGRKKEGKEEGKKE